MTNDLQNHSIAELTERLRRGAVMLWDMEQQGQRYTDDYATKLSFYERVLAVYERKCDEEEGSRPAAP